MAEPTSREACAQRHRSYHIDVGQRLKRVQIERIEKMVYPIMQGEIVLDVGCNSGYIVDFLPKHCRVYGVELSDPLAKLAAERLVGVKVAEADELPYPDRSMDVVILGEIIEHVFDPVHTVKEATRVARRLVLGSTPHEESKWGPHGANAPSSHRYHVRCFTAPELRKVLEDASLSDIHIAVIPPTRPQFYVFRGAAQ